MSSLCPPSRRNSSPSIVVRPEEEGEKNHEDGRSSTTQQTCRRALSLQEGGEEVIGTSQAFSPPAVPLIYFQFISPFDVMDAAVRLEREKRMKDNKAEFKKRKKLADSKMKLAQQKGNEEKESPSNDDDDNDVDLEQVEEDKDNFNEAAPEPPVQVDLRTKSKKSQLRRKEAEDAKRSKVAGEENGEREEERKELQVTEAGIGHPKMKISTMRNKNISSWKAHVIFVKNGSMQQHHHHQPPMQSSCCVGEFTINSEMTYANLMSHVLEWIGKTDEEKNIFDTISKTNGGGNNNNNMMSRDLVFFTTCHSSSIELISTQFASTQQTEKTTTGYKRTRSGRLILGAADEEGTNEEEGEEAGKNQQDRKDDLRLPSALRYHAKMKRKQRMKKFHFSLGHQTSFIVNKIFSLNEKISRENQLLFCCRSVVENAGEEDVDSQINKMGYPPAPWEGPLGMGGEKGRDRFDGKGGFRTPERQVMIKELPIITTTTAAERKLTSKKNGDVDEEVINDDYYHCGGNSRRGTTTTTPPPPPSSRKNISGGVEGFGGNSFLYASTQPKVSSTPSSQECASISCRSLPKPSPSSILVTSGGVGGAMARDTPQNPSFFVDASTQVQSQYTQRSVTNFQNIGNSTPNGVEEGEGQGHQQDDFMMVMPSPAPFVKNFNNCLPMHRLLHRKFFVGYLAMMLDAGPLALCEFPLVLPDPITTSGNILSGSDHFYAPPIHNRSRPPSTGEDFIRYQTNFLHALQHCCPSVGYLKRLACFPTRTTTTTTKIKKFKGVPCNPQGQGNVDSVEEEENGREIEKGSSHSSCTTTTSTTKLQILLLSDAQTQQKGGTPDEGEDNDDVNDDATTTTNVVKGVMIIYPAIRPREVVWFYDMHEQEGRCPADVTANYQSDSPHLDDFCSPLSHHKKDRSGVEGVQIRRRKKHAFVENIFFSKQNLLLFDVVEIETGKKHLGQSVKCIEPL